MPLDAVEPRRLKERWFAIDAEMGDVCRAEGCDEHWQALRAEAEDVLRQIHHHERSRTQAETDRARRQYQALLQADG